MSPNIIGTHSLHSLARAEKSRAFLLFSSSEIYGDSGTQDTPIREDMYGYLDPTRVRSCYAESKRMAETMCASWFHQFGVPTRIVRPFHTYGPGMALDDGRIFADFVANIIARQDLVIRSNGKAIRAFCYLADAIAGFLRVLLIGENAAAYNIGNDREVCSIGELADILIREFGERELSLVFAPRRPEADYSASPVSRSSPDISRARGLGLRPVVSIAEGFRRTVTSLEEMGMPTH